MIRETLKADPLKDREKPVRHIIFIEEAHNLIAPEAQIQDSMDSNPKVAATAFIVKMLAEVRALREGIIIADQLPTAMAPEVIKNTNIKLVHRLTSGDDRELVGSTMSASGLQMENMATYTSGQALFTYEKLLRPFQMQVSMVEQHGTETPTDDELYSLMLQKPVFKKYLQRLQYDKFDFIANKIANLLDDENEKSHTLFGLDKIDFTKVSRSRFVNYINSCKGVLSELFKSREECLSMISKLDASQIGDEDIKSITELATAIGKSFESCMNNFIRAYELFYKE